jgi:hypothetical protein
MLQHLRGGTGRAAVMKLIVIMVLTMSMV